MPEYFARLAGVTSSNGTLTKRSTGCFLISFSAASTAPEPWPAAFWNTVTFRSPAFIEASASGVASMPATIDDGVHFFEAFSALIAPMAISSLLAITASNFAPDDSKLVMMSWPLVRVRAASFESSPISTSTSPLPLSRRQTSCVCSVPETFSSEATKATPAGSFSKSTGLRFT